MNRIDYAAPSEKAGSSAAAVTRSGALPNVVVIGAMKCGTSAVHYCIDVHPDASMSNPKEVNFFYDEPEQIDEVNFVDPRELRMVHHGRGTWAKGEKWYRSLFDPEAKIRGESSPAYTAPWNPHAAAQMAEMIPDAKLIFSVRDPVERMLSEYQHHELRGLEWRDVNEALSRVDGPYLARSRYWERLKPFLEHYPEEQILVISQEMLASETRSTLRTIFEFLEVDPDYWDEKMERRWNTTGNKDWRRRYLERLRGMRGMGWTYNIPREWKWRMRRLVYRGETTEVTRPELRPEVRAQIEAELATDVEQLRRWSGLELADWSI